ncbi:MAG: hypothetical protein VW080_05070, partial [Flavobacteriaceae bacterium]
VFLFPFFLLTQKIKTRSQHSKQIKEPSHCYHWNTFKGNISNCNTQPLMNKEESILCVIYYQFDCKDRSLY